MCKILRLIAICFIYSIYPSNKLYGQWEKISTIYGGNSLTQIVETSNKLMAIGYPNLYLSEKDTVFWNKQPMYENLLSISIAASNDTLFNLYRANETGFPIYLRISFNEGDTWENPIFIGNLISMNITLNYINETLILCGYIDGQCQIRKSNDLGVSWAIESLPPQISYINKVFDYNDTHLVFSVGNQNDVVSVFSYSLENSSWFAISNSSQTQNQMYSVILNDRILLAKQEVDGLKIYSTDLNGNDDQLIHTNSSAFSTSGLHKINNFLVYAVYEIGEPTLNIYTSEDEGFTFTLNSSFSHTISFNNVLNLQSGESIILSNRLSKLNEYLQQFSLIEDGLTLIDPDYIRSINDILYVSKKGLGFYKSLDNGITFENITNSNGIPHGEILNQGDTLLYASIDLDHSSKFVRCTENDLNVEYLPADINYLTPIAENQTSALFNGKIFTLNFLEWQTEMELLTSDDFGETWEEMNSPSDDYGIFHILNGNLYFFSHNLFKYEQTTNNWIEINSPIESDGFYSECRLKSIGENLWVKNEDDFHAILLPDEITWIDNTNLRIEDVVKIGNVAYGIGWSDLLVSFDNGQNWLLSGIYLPQSGSYRRLCSHGSDLYIYGIFDSPIYKLTSPEITPGKIYFDSNNNGQFDSQENGISDVLINSENFPSYIMSDVSGNFAIFNSEVIDTLTLQLNNPFQTSVPDSTFLNNQDEIFIGIQMPDSISDFMVDAIIYEVFRPGFSTNVSLVVKNLGSISQSGELSLLLPQQIILNSSSISPNSQIGNVINWNIENLTPFEVRYINLEFLTNASGNLIGDTLTFQANITPVLNDINLPNNSVTQSSIIVGAYDPNDKTCYRGELVTPTQLNNNNEFEYLIRFQNTGTFYAENVVIQDTISSYFDLSTMRIIASSDTMNVTFGDNNLVNFNFPLIFLPDSTTNEPESHGFVKYAIRTKPNLELGTVLRNTAYIYFDFNEPIITNTTETLYDLPSSIELNEEQNVLVYPNPTNSTVKLMEYSSANVSVSLTDLSGKTVAVQKCINGELDLSRLNPGIYLGVIQASKGQPARRFKVVKM
jgi:hypothetical protein